MIVSELCLKSCAIKVEKKSPDFFVWSMGDPVMVTCCFQDLVYTLRMHPSPGVLTSHGGGQRSLVIVWLGVT